MVEFLAFGNVTVGQRNFSIEAWLYDVRNSSAPPLSFGSSQRKLPMPRSGSLLISLPTK